MSPARNGLSPEVGVGARGTAASLRRRNRRARAKDAEWAGDGRGAPIRPRAGHGLGQSGRQEPFPASVGKAGSKNRRAAAVMLRGAPRAQRGRPVSSGSTADARRRHPRGRPTTDRDGERRRAANRSNRQREDRSVSRRRCRRRPSNPPRRDRDHRPTSRQSSSSGLRPPRT